MSRTLFAKDAHVNMFKMCFNWKVIAGLAVVAAGVYMVAPAAFAAALPLLFLAACPLSMLLMMKMMSGDSAQKAGEKTDSQATRATPAQSADPDELDAELQRLQARQTAIADQLDAMRREEREQV